MNYSNQLAAAGSFQFACPSDFLFSGTELRELLQNVNTMPAKPTHADKLAQARARHGKSFACDPGSTFRYRRDRTILDDWQDALREQRAVAQAEVPGLLREQAA